MFIAVPEIAKLVHFQVIRPSHKEFGDGFKMTSARLFESASRLDNKILGISMASRPPHSALFFPLVFNGKSMASVVLTITRILADLTGRVMQFCLSETLKILPLNRSLAFSSLRKLGQIALHLEKKIGLKVLKFSPRTSLQYTETFSFSFPWSTLLTIHPKT